MADFADERLAIETRFAAAWGATTPVRYENDVAVLPPDLPSVALTIRSSVGQSITLGDHPLTRFIGVVIVQVFVGEGAGTGPVRALCDQIAAIWRDGTGRGAQVPCGNGLIQFFPSYLEAAGPRLGYHQTNLNTPYYRDISY